MKGELTMLKKETTFTNFNDVEVTKTFWFNLSKTEVLKLANTHGGIEEYFKQIYKKKDATGFIEFVEELVLMAYGKRYEDDPEKFDKSRIAKEEFENSEAFGEIVYQLLTDEKLFTEFFYGIMPKDIRTQMENVSSEEAKKLITNA